MDLRKHLYVLSILIGLSTAMAQDSSATANLTGIKESIITFMSTKRNVDFSHLVDVDEKCKLVIHRRYLGSYDVLSSYYKKKDNCSQYEDFWFFAYIDRKNSQWFPVFIDILADGTLDRVIWSINPDKEIQWELLFENFEELEKIENLATPVWIYSLPKPFQECVVFRNSSLNEQTKEIILDPTLWKETEENLNKEWTDLQTNVGRIIALMQASSEMFKTVLNEFHNQKSDTFYVGKRYQVQKQGKSVLIKDLESRGNPYYVDKDANGELDFFVKIKFIDDKLEDMVHSVFLKYLPDLPAPKAIKSLRKDAEAQFIEVHTPSESLPIWRETEVSWLKILEIIDNELKPSKE